MSVEGSEDLESTGKDADVAISAAEEKIVRARTDAAEISTLATLVFPR